MKAADRRGKIQGLGNQGIGGQVVAVDPGQGKLVLVDVADRAHEREQHHLALAPA